MNTRFIRRPAFEVVLAYVCCAYLSVVIARWALAGFPVMP